MVTLHNVPIEIFMLVGWIFKIIVKARPGDNIVSTFQQINGE